MASAGIPPGAEADGRDNVGAQIMALEATFDSMLQQAATALRRDMTAREERLVQRMDSDRREHQSAIFELRRDITMHHSEELSAHEDRLSRRLEGERRETKAALVELRRDVGTQQDHRVQIANLRRDLGTTQAALAKLATTRGSLASSTLDTRTPSSPSHAATSEALEAISDLRREQSGQREQIELQAANVESSLARLRKELIALQAEEIRSVQEHLSRSTAELANNIRDVTTTVEMSANTARQDFKREVERLRCEFEVERSQSEQRAGYLGMIEARSQSAMRRVEEVEKKFATMRHEGTRNATLLQTTLDANIDSVAARDGTSGGNAVAEVASLRTQFEETIRDVSKLSDTVTQLQVNFAQVAQRADATSVADVSRKLSALETEWYTSAGALKRAVDDTKLTVGKLAKDVVRESKERCDAIDDLAKRIEAEAPCSSSPRASQLINELTAHDSVSERGASKAEGSRSSILDATSVELEAALAGCVGQLDTEFRLEMSERINTVIADLRGEIATCCGGLEAELERMDSRVKALESARLDLRIGSLEAACQHGAVFTAGPDMNKILDGTVDQLAANLLHKRVVQDVEEAALAADARRRSKIDAEDIQRIREIGTTAVPFTGGRRLSAEDLDVSQPVSHILEADGSARESVEAAQDLRSELLLNARSAFAEEIVAQEAQGQDPTDYAAALSYQAGAAHTPLISDELKDRLETLVNQVKQTLSKSHSNDSLQDSQQQQSAYNELAAYKQRLAAVAAAGALSPRSDAPTLHSVRQTPLIKSMQQVDQTQVLQTALLQPHQPPFSMTPQAETPASVSFTPISRMREVEFQPTPIQVSGSVSFPASGTVTPATRFVQPYEVLRGGPVQAGPARLKEIRVYEPEPVDPARKRSMSPIRARSPVRRATSPLRTSTVAPTPDGRRSPSPLRRGDGLSVSFPTVSAQAGGHVSSMTGSFASSASLGAFGGSAPR